MLNVNDKKKIERYIQKIVDELMQKSKADIELGKNDEQVIEQVTKASVNRFTPESKMILSSVYNMLKEKTFSEDVFQSLDNKAAFYKLDIFSELNDKFIFQVPQKIDFKNKKTEFRNLIFRGWAVVVIAGGIAYVAFDNKISYALIVAIAMSVVIVGYIYRKKKENSSHRVELIVSDYLRGVQSALLAWIETIELFYDNKIEQLRKEGNV